MHFSKSANSIYYVIPDIHRKNFSVVNFFRYLKKGNLIGYLKEYIFVSHKPVGGIKVFYQHCLILNDLGFKAYPLIMGQYHGNFFGYDVETKTIKEVGFKLNKGDVLVVPEFLPYMADLFECDCKILFVQCTPYINFKRDDFEKRYVDLGYRYIWYCSKYLGDMILGKDILCSFYIPNYIDHDAFKPSDENRVSKSVLAFPRKNPDALKVIKEAFDDDSIRFSFIDGLNQSQLVLEYQKADIFLTVSYPEGFGLTPLEAMACGCVVVGFTGGGGDEFMLHDYTAMVSNDGDIDDVVYQLKQIVHDEDKKESLRRAGLKMSKKYNFMNTKKSLSEFFEQRLGS